jgi:hypothetical protein
VVQVSNLKNTLVNESLFPIIIGVTGHRDLRPEDIPRLEAKVREIFEDLQIKYPHTPLQVLSPLAEGADRLVARIGLELGAELIVPLSMPREEYERDFTTPESKKEFAKLSGMAVMSFELPMADGNTLEKIQTDVDYRNRQYAQIGAYVADHSQILLALWDGVFKNTVGGTSNIVRFKEGAPELQNPSERILDPIDSGPVYHIITPRVSNPIPQGGEVFSLHKRFPGGKIDDAEMDKAYLHILQRMDDFNRDGLQLTAKKPDAVLQSKKNLIDPETIDKLPAPSRVVLERYAIADALAVQYQKKRRRTMIGLFTLVGLAVVCMENYDGLAEREEPAFQYFRYLLPVYLGSLGIAFLWHRFARYREYQNKHIEYRALAEGLRVQFFWQLAGINEDVSEHYLRKQRSELEWIRNAIRSSNLRCEEPPVVDCKQGLSLTHQYWLRSQSQFYQKAVGRDERKLGHLERIMKVMISLGITLSLGVVIIDAFGKLEMDDLEHKTMRIMMQILPALGAAFGGYAMKMALAEQVKRYERMGELYLQAEKCLAGLIEDNDIDCARQLIRELGDEALIENADWLFLHRERPMEVPLGG